MGGTEVFVAGLARALAVLGVESSVVVGHSSDQTLVHNGVRVCRYATRQPSDRLSEFYGGADEFDSGFARCLQTEKPDVLHIHAFNPGVSRGMVRAAKARQIPVVFTYHTPAATCPRRTLLRWGVEPCAGLMDVHDCARCTLEGLISRKADGRWPMAKARKRVPQLVGSLPPAFGCWLGKLDLQGGVWTALGMTELVRSRHAVTRAFLNEVDHVVAVCEWVRQVLLRNGVPETKITLCPCGITKEAASREQPGEVASQRRHGTGKAEIQNPSTLNSQPSTLRICFLGRLDPTKGVHILLHALRSIPQAPVKLDIYGVAQGEGGRNYEQTLRRIANDDDRVKFCLPVPPTEIIAILKNYDLLAVPSQILETGPLVVWEAFAAGVPVLGSRLGGIADRVQDGVDGILVEADSIESWAAALARLAGEPGLLEKLRLEIQPPRAMSDVASEMIGIYSELLTR